MNPQEVEKVLGILADKLGPKAEFVWKTLVRYQYIESGIGLSVGIVLCTLTTWGLVKVIKSIKKNEDIEDIHGVLMLVIGVTGLVGIGFVANNLLTLLNPEYFAIRALIGK